ncbi:protein NO VEIN domain-containing protein [Vibrio sp. WJH972]
MKVTTDELASILAGGDSYIRTKDNVVKGLAITTQKNPEAPEIIVVGKGPRIVRNAQLFLECQRHVPVYVKQATNQWEFMGNYKADNYLQDSATIEKYRRHRSAEDIDGILFLSTDFTEDVIVQPRTVIDNETKKKVELSAINTVISHFESKGYQVFDRQKDNCGYDLLAEKGNNVLKLEVKGTSSEKQRFFLSRNEQAKSVDPLWRLAIVTSALFSPHLEVLNTEEMESRFNFSAMCWECTLP